MPVGLGRGGKTAVAEMAQMSRNTVIKAAGEVEAGIGQSVRLRAPGGDVIKAEITQPGLLQALDELVDRDPGESDAQCALDVQVDGQAGQ